MKFVVCFLYTTTTTTTTTTTAAAAAATTTTSSRGVAFIYARIRTPVRIAYS